MTVEKFEKNLQKLQTEFELDDELDQRIFLKIMDGFKSMLKLKDDQIDGF